MARKIVFLVFPHAHLLDLAGPAQVFYEVSQHGGRLYELIFAASAISVSTRQFLHLARLTTVDDMALDSRHANFLGFGKRATLKQPPHIVCNFD